ncbi:MAG: glycosyltransferase family 2 protein [Deltaproteobacteria bacterium]|nr:glycosyltransferase family 2 protein [Deltaproteobacteria bacterium]
MTDPDITLVIPVFNGAHALDDALCEIDDWRSGRSGRAFVLFVDDGSDDGTFDHLAGWVRERADSQVVRLAANHGLHTALRAGFEHATTQLVATTEINIEHDPAAIDRLIAYATDGIDAVCARRVGRSDPWWRMAPSRAINAFARLLGGLRIHDVHCLLKVWRREFALRAFSDVSHGHFLRTLCEGNLAEVAIDFTRRRYGVSRFSPAALGRAFLQMVCAVIALRFGVRPSHRHPTRFTVREIVISETTP